MGNFARALHHLDMKDVKKRHLKELAARKIKEEQDKKEKKVIQEIAKKYKSDWRKDLKENFTAVPSGPTNSVSQTFQHVSGQNFSFSGLGGQETHPSTVTVFGDTIPAPNYNQLALAGYAKPLGNVLKRKEIEDTNSKLDASQEFAQKVGADVMMNARVKTELSLEQKKEAVKKYKNEMEEYSKKDIERYDEIKSRIQSNISKVKSFVGKYGEKLSDSYPTGSSDVRIAEGGKTLVVISHSGFNYDDSQKFNVRVYEAEKGKRISMVKGNFGYFSGSIADNPFNKRKSSGQSTFMYKGIGAEVENKTFSIKEVPPVTMPTPPEFMKKNLSNGWQIVTKDDEEFIKKQEKNILFNVKHVYPGAELAGKLAIQMAKGDKTPFTKSPGKGFDNQVMKLIERKIDNNIKGSVITDDVYGKASILDKGLDLPVRLSIGQFTYTVKDGGIEVYDDFDFDLNTAVGYGSFIPGLQKTANRFVGIMMRRAAELGYDMKSGKSPIYPVYQGEEDYHGGLATPDGFGIDVRYTIPWNQVSSELQSKLGKPSKAVKRIKSMTKTRGQSLSLDEPIVRRKKKGVDI